MLNKNKGRGARGAKEEEMKTRRQRGRCIKRKKITQESGDGKEEPHDPEEEGGVDGRGR